MPQNLQPGLHSLEEGVYYGPKNTNYLDIVMTDDILRSQTTSRNNKTYADKPYDFPRLEIQNPKNRFIGWDPISTFSMYQTESYAKRYSDPANIPVMDNLRNNISNAAPEFSEKNANKE